MITRAAFLATSGAAVGAAVAVTSCGPQNWMFEAAAVIDSDASATPARDATTLADAGAADGDVHLSDGESSFEGSGGFCPGQSCRSACNAPLCADGAACPFGHCVASCDAASPCPTGTVCVAGGCVECVPGGMGCDGGRMCMDGFCSMSHR